MVNAQQYIENNFPKNVSEILAIGKNLEGDLDLSEYPNLTNLDVGFNSRLTSLKLAPSNRITEFSIYKCIGITDYSFLVNTPNLSRFCITGMSKDNHADKNNPHFAKTIRDTCREKDRQLREKDREIAKLNQQLSNSQQDKDEIIKLQTENNKLREQLNQQIITNLNQLLVQSNIINSQLIQQNQHFQTQNLQSQEKLKKLENAVYKKLDITGEQLISIIEEKNVEETQALLAQIAVNPK